MTKETERQQFPPKFPYILFFRCIIYAKRKRKVITKNQD